MCGNYLKIKSKDQTTQILNYPHKIHHGALNLWKISGNCLLLNFQICQIMTSLKSFGNFSKLASYILLMILRHYLVFSVSRSAYFVLPIKASKTRRPKKYMYVCEMKFYISRLLIIFPRFFLFEMKNIFLVKLCEVDL
jgi:hypothetical protein